MPRRPARPGALKDLAPLRILTQIALLQLSYYLVAIILIAFISVVGTGQRPASKDFFDWRELRGDVTKGWTLGLCWMLDSLVTYVRLCTVSADRNYRADMAMHVNIGLSRSSFSSPAANSSRTLRSPSTSSTSSSPPSTPARYRRASTGGWCKPPPLLS